jgi:hypothetical protein
MVQTFKGTINKKFPVPGSSWNLNLGVTEATGNVGFDNLWQTCVSPGLKTSKTVGFAKRFFPFRKTADFSITELNGMVTFCLVDRYSGFGGTYVLRRRYQGKHNVTAQMFLM